MNILFDCLNFEDVPKVVCQYSLEDMLKMYIDNRFLWTVIDNDVESLHDGLLYITENFNQEGETYRHFRIKYIKYKFKNRNQIQSYLDIQKRNYKINKLLDI